MSRPDGSPSKFLAVSPCLKRVVSFDDAGSLLEFLEGTKSPQIVDSYPPGLPPRWGAYKLVPVGDNESEGNDGAEP